MNILDNFRLGDEKESFQSIHDDIKNSIDFKGTNLWVLIFAILIASLGLNVNSTAVVIGAMLISPLMGPIMGMGFSMAVNDLKLLKRSFFSYLIAAGVSLFTSTTYFFLSPINDAHSELLARTSPNIYDVLIALFGGLAAMLATSSKIKGNVIAGAAIATALMPPLCTAGYGLATLQPKFIFGAFYLFLINTVFIALATLLTGRFLKFPVYKLSDPKAQVRAKRIVFLIVTATLLPSMYFGYDLIRQNKFINTANSFIEKEAVFPNDYLLKKNIDPKNRSITLTFGGDLIADSEIEKLNKKLENYQLGKASLIINQGFSYLQKDNKEENRLSAILADREKRIDSLAGQLDSIHSLQLLPRQIFLELKAQRPTITSLALEQTGRFTENDKTEIWICEIGSTEKIDEKNEKIIEDWLKIRLHAKNIKIHFTQ